MVLLYEDYTTEKQIDRACAAQSPEMLPDTPVDKQKLSQAQDKVQQEKAQYKVPAEKWHFDRI